MSGGGGGGGRGGGGGVGGSFEALVFPAAAADRDVPQSATASPVALASLAKVARLGQAVVVVVTKFGVGRITTRTPERLLLGLFLVRLLVLVLCCRQLFVHY